MAEDVLVWLHRWHQRSTSSKRGRGEEAERGVFTAIHRVPNSPWLQGGHWLRDGDGRGRGWHVDVFSTTHTKDLRVGYEGKLGLKDFQVTCDEDQAVTSLHLSENWRLFFCVCVIILFPIIIVINSASLIPSSHPTSLYLLQRILLLTRCIFVVGWMAIRKSLWW